MGNYIFHIHKEANERNSIHTHAPQPIASALKITRGLNNEEREDEKKQIETHAHNFIKQQIEKDGEFAFNTA